MKFLINFFLNFFPKNKTKINKWCEEAGSGIEIEFESKHPKIKPTPIDETNPYWIAFRNVMVDKL